MSAPVALLDAPPPPPSSFLWPTGPAPGAPHRWTVEGYEHLGKLGALSPEDHVELLDGMIVDKEMNHPPHAECVDRLTAFFHVANSGRWWVRGQHPVRLPGQPSLPEPDLVLARCRPGGYGGEHPAPTDIYLLVEVSNTSVEVDRGRKLALCARAGIPEYWIVNLPGRVVEVYRQPDADAGIYQDSWLAGPGDRVAPAAFPDADLPVGELFG